MKKVQILSIMLLFSITLHAQKAFQWAKRMGGVLNSTTQGTSVSIDGNGNVFTTGYFDDTTDFDPGAGVFTMIPASVNNDDIFISKLSASGNFLWAKRIGGGSTFNDNGLGISVDGSGCVYTTGFFKGTADFDPGAGTFNMTSSGTILGEAFIVKLDSSGNFIWAKQFGGNGTGSSSVAIVLDGNANVYITGDFDGTVDFDPGAGNYNLTAAGNTDVFVSKLDSSGNFIWAKQIGGADYEYPKSIALDSNENVYTTGNFYGTADFNPGTGIYPLTSAGGKDIFISKLDSAGNYVWAVRLGNSADNDRPTSVSIDHEGNVYASGYFVGTVDFNPNPGVFSLTSAGNQDIYVLKLNSSGNFIWAKRIGGTSVDEAYASAIDKKENIYLTGNFAGTVDFDPSVNVFNMTSISGTVDAYICELDSAGNFVWAGQMGGSSNQSGNSISLDSDDNVYVTGYFQGTCDLNPLAGTFNLSASGFEDAFIMKMSVCSAAINVSQPISCYGSCNGSLSGSGTSSFTPYTYLWNNSDTSQTTDSLCANTYTLTMTDAGLCSVTSSFVLTEPTAISTSFVSSQPLCYGDCNGSVTVVVSGGVPPYTNFQWSTGDTAQAQTNLCAGSNSVSLIDSNGCSASDSFLLTEPAVLVLGNLITLNPTCTGCSNGSICISNSTGGTLPYTYTWAPFVGTINGCGITNLPADTYSVCITDANGCTMCNTDTLVDSPVGIIHLSGIDGIVVYPNPSNDKVIVSNTGKEKSLTFTLLNILGEVLWEEEINASYFILDTAKYGEGIFMLRVQSGESQQFYKLIFTN